MAIRIGTSGWSYDHWHPELYAPGLPARDRLAHYGAFATAELNSSFTGGPGRPRSGAGGTGCQMASGYRSRRPGA